MVRVNLYGPPLHVPETRAIAQLTKKAATLGYNHDPDHLDQYQNFPQKASTYRGRLLVSEKVVEKAPKGHEKDRVSFACVRVRVCVCRHIVTLHLSFRTPERRTWY